MLRQFVDDERSGDRNLISDIGPVTSSAGGGTNGKRDEAEAELWREWGQMQDTVTVLVSAMP